MYSNNFMSLFDKQKFVFNMTDDPNERLDIQHKMMLQEYYARQEREQLIEEIAKRVLERISVRADTKDAVSKIESLQKAIDGLTQNRG